MKISDLTSKRARRRARSGRASRVFAKKNGRAGWKLRFLPFHAATPERLQYLAEKGFEELEKESPSQ